MDDLLSRNYFSNRSDSTFYLIQNHSERGYWGKIDLSRSDDLSSIYTLSAEMEGMGELSFNMLLGFLIKEDKKYCFNEVIADGSTKVHSRQYYLFSKDKGIIWHG